MNALSICCSSALLYKTDTGLISRRNSLDLPSVTYRESTAERRGSFGWKSRHEGVGTEIKGKKERR